jgi:hypothetical protein
VKNLYVIGITVVFLLSCGKSYRYGGGAGVDHATASQIVSVSTTDSGPSAGLAMQRQFKNIKSNSEDKALGVGGLAVMTGKRPHPTDPEKNLVDYVTCSTALLDDGEVITAAHCVPEEIRTRKTGCSAMSFLHAEEKDEFKCTQILWSTTDEGELKFSDYITADGASADILIFKVSPKPTKILPLHLANSYSNPTQRHRILAFGVPPEEKGSDVSQSLTVTLQPIIRNNLTFIFEGHERCSVSDFPAKNFPIRRVNCPVDYGNSGAPLLNAKNEVQGIINGFLDHKKSGFYTDLGCLTRNGDKFTWNCPTHANLDIDF